MTEERRRPLSDPKAMRALAHPARLRILHLLQVQGAATATELAEVVGVTPSAASYHLRMLAKYGFTTDAQPRGDGRERLWRWMDKSLALDTDPDDPPELKAAKDLLIRTVHDDAREELDRALSAIERDTAEWRDATMWARTIMLMTAEEMRQLGVEVEKLMEPYRAATREHQGRVPEGVRVVEAQFTVFPRAERRRPGLPTEVHQRRD